MSQNSYSRLKNLYTKVEQFLCKRNELKNKRKIQKSLECGTWRWLYAWRSDYGRVKSNVCFCDYIAKDSEGDACVEVAMIALLSTSPESPSLQTLGKSVKELEFEELFWRNVEGHWCEGNYIRYGRSLDVSHCMGMM